MFRFAAFRILVALAALVVSVPLHAGEGAAVAKSELTPSYILVGFTGGFVRHDNPYHGSVQLAQRMQRSTPKNASIQVFENRHRKSAYNAILRMLDANHDGSLSDEEKSHAHIILFGHSWGASAVVMLARELNRVGIPVLLTVQVDSVAKPWQSDGVIPENVAAAANFYQPHGLIHGRSQITAANPAKTQIVGNYRFDYQKQPVICGKDSWFDRITPNHAQSECDPRLWTQVEDLVRQHMQPLPASVAALP